LGNGFAGVYLHSIFSWLAHTEIEKNQDQFNKKNEVNHKIKKKQGSQYHRKFV
jgi:hypothetical protein